nr:hypothetical protein KE13KAR1_00014 [African swine fever virus]CAK8179500.1 hypothetical protein KE13BUS3WSL_00013 [African swine fever virus]CAK8179661.1 hypothetical protein KE13BUS3WLD_KE13BUS3WLD_00014 [African swine fever virus]CAK8180008.1 hypothetical protein KE12BUS5_00013 [African swine fever virus]CAK8180166.1 hypothetical protein KE13SIA4_00013 [African swine fever virus]
MYRLRLINRDSKGMETLPSIQSLNFNLGNVSVYEKKIFLLMYEFLYGVAGSIKMLLPQKK